MISGSFSQITDEKLQSTALYRWTVHSLVKLSVFLDFGGSNSIWPVNVAPLGGTRGHEALADILWPFHALSRHLSSCFNSIHLRPALYFGLRVRSVQRVELKAEN